MHLRQTERPARGGAPGLCLSMLLLFALGACQPRKPYPPASNGGNAAQGKALLVQYQCGSCHLIPDVEGARGIAAPSLAEFARRSYVAGRWPNDQATLVRWIAAPRSMDPETLMPELGVSAEDARHMAAYLYTLE